ncbi:MAG: 16S rRNA (cytidine(1402)-2'-O)-methyltransferase, partial [Actinobacteria bacterium]|nr:16S rRNA (cytidine(1402)-2'-O)-methyltransferase [Actinomycetota bacterium]
MLILAAIPLGNPGDASFNLKSAIQSAKFIAAEDSRKFSRLCSDLEVTHSAKIISFFEGNEIERLDELVRIMESGSDLLVVTDAGMPGISDPGYRLVRAAVDKNIQIKVLPGPSAVTTALLLSGLPSDRFCFEGFAPRTSGARQSWFENLANEPRTIILFEAPHRLLECLEDAKKIFGPNRSAAICREMTKTYEEVIRGDLEQLHKWAATSEILGEITLVIAGFDPRSREFSEADLIAEVLKQEAAGISRKEAITEV